MRSFFKNWHTVFPLIVLLLLIWSGSWAVADLAEAQHLQNALQSPSSQHWLGTDQYGRDMWARVLVGGRLSVSSAVITVGLMVFLGMSIGLVGGYRQGRVDVWLMRLTDMVLAFPSLVLAIVTAALWGGGLEKACIVLAVLSWPKYARLTRSLTLAVREAPYVEVAKRYGVGDFTILHRHILPNVWRPLAVTAVLDIGVVIMELAGLSFLGLGALPPDAEWGAMISQGRSFLQTAPWLVAGPGIALILTVGAFNWWGDALHDRWER